MYHQHTWKCKSETLARAAAEIWCLVSPSIQNSHYSNAFNLSLCGKHGCSPAISAVTKIVSWVILLIFFIFSIKSPESLI